MNKEELKYLLITEKKDWKYYSENAERKQLFLEVLENGFPYAIKVFSEAPAQFVTDWGNFKDKNFQNVYLLYTQKKSENERKEYYCKAFENLNDKNTLFDFLENEFWNKSTIEMLDLYKKCHSKFKSDKKNEKSEIKEFHSKCIEKISEILIFLDKLKQDAIVRLNAVELQEIREVLCSDLFSDEYKIKIQRLLKTHLKEVFIPNFFKDIYSGYIMQDWLNVYITTAINCASAIDFDTFVVDLFNHPVAEKINKKLLIECFTNLKEKKQVKIFESISNIAVFDCIFEYYTSNFNRPDEVKKITGIYLNKFKDSGTAINNVVNYISKGRSTINSLPEIIEEYSKRWFINFNYHNREDEIGDVVEALANVEKFNELFIDTLFWKKMENCNAFINIIDNISVFVGFEKCYDFILKNYLSAKAFGEKKLMNKWMQAANSIAINYEDAQETFIQFVGNLLDEGSMLDNHSKKVLTNEIIYNILQQASDNKKRFELEKRKSDDIKNECLKDFFFHIFTPMDKLERSITGFSEVSDGVDEETMKALRTLYGKIRLALSNSGLYPIVDVENWVKRKVISYDSNLHVCVEDVKNGESVICLTMGMKDAKMGFFEKASVKLLRGEENNGNDL